MPLLMQPNNELAYFFSHITLQSLVGPLSCWSIKTEIQTCAGIDRLA